MDEVIVATDNTNYSVISLILGFLLLLLIIGLIILIIYLVIPKNDVQLGFACTTQSECQNGLTCSISSLDNTKKCLGGIGYPCQKESECGCNLGCIANVCTVKPASTSLTLESAVNLLPTFIDQTLLQNTINTQQPLILQTEPCPIQNPPCLNQFENILQPVCPQPRVTQTTCHQTKTFEPLKSVYNFDFNSIYNTIRNVDCQNTNMNKKKLVNYL